MTNAFNQAYDKFQEKQYKAHTLVLWLSPTETSTILLLDRVTGTRTGHNVVRFVAGGGGGGG